MAVFEVDFIAALNIVSGIAVGFYLKRRRILNLLRARRRQVAQVFISCVVDLVLRRLVESYVNSLAARRRRQAVGTRDLQGLVLQVDAACSRAAVGNIQRRYARRSIVNHVRYVLCRRYAVIARYAYRSARVGKSALLHVVRNRSVRTGRSRVVYLIIRRRIKAYRQGLAVHIRRNTVSAGYL